LGTEQAVIEPVRMVRKFAQAILPDA